MKFLTIGVVSQSARNIPPSVIRPLMETTLVALNRQKEEGKILDYYSVPGWKKNVMIWECQSAEELAKVISDSPVTMYMDIEVYPLIDGFEALNAGFENLKKAEKAMPIPPR